MSYKVITHDALCVAAARWLHRHHDNCNIPNCFLCAVDVSFWTIYKERPDVVGFSSSAPPVLIEVKTSTSDFKADADKLVRKYPDRGIGAFRFYCTPENLIKKDTLPPGWGLLEYADGKMSIIKESGYFEHSFMCEQKLLLSILRREGVHGVYSCRNLEQTNEANYDRG